MQSEGFNTLYLKLAGEIEADILQSGRREGDKYISIREITVKFGISQITAVNAVEYLKKIGVLETVERKGLFVKRLPATEPLKIHYLLREDTPGVFLHPYHAEIISGIKDFLKSGDGSTELHLSPYNPDEAELAKNMERIFSRHKNVSAIVADETPGRLEGILSDMNIPFAMIAGTEKTSGLRLIKSDEKKGALETAEHLYKLGHRNILILCRKMKSGSIDTASERLDALKEAFRKYPEITVSFQDIGGVSFEDGLEAGEKAIRSIKAKSISAVVAYCDDVAAGFMQKLAAHNLKIPDDISLSSYNDLPVARLLTPPLTTVALPCRRMGAAAAKALLEKYRGYEFGGASVEVYPEALVIRASTGKLQRQN